MPVKQVEIRPSPTPMVGIQSTIQTDKRYKYDVLQLKLKSIRKLHKIKSTIKERIRDAR